MREDLVIRGPLYFNLDRTTLALNPTDPSHVGARPATHTLYWFSTDYAYTAVMVTGEGETMPPEPVIREAEFQIYGAAQVTP